jgi:hypothetical protein
VAGFEFKKGDKGLGYYRTTSNNNHNIATDPTVKKKKKKRALAQTKQVGRSPYDPDLILLFQRVLCFFSVWAGLCLILSLDACLLAFPFTLGCSCRSSPK